MRLTLHVPNSVSDMFCIGLDQSSQRNDYSQMLGCVAYSPRLRKSKTLCIVYFLLDAWSSNLRTRICSLLKTVSQSIKYTMYTPTCNLTWGHKTGESMQDNWALSKKCPFSVEGHGSVWVVTSFKITNIGSEGIPPAFSFIFPHVFCWVMLGTMWACEHVLVSCDVYLRKILHNRKTCQSTGYWFYTTTQCF